MQQTVSDNFYVSAEEMLLLSVSDNALHLPKDVAITWPDVYVCFTSSTSHAYDYTCRIIYE